MTTRVTPRDFSEIRWRGHWIWVPEELIVPSGFMSTGINPQAKEAYSLFRKTVHLAGVPARITADSRYIMFVNGQEVFRGPIRSQPRRLRCEALTDPLAIDHPRPRLSWIVSRKRGTRKKELNKEPNAYS